MIKKTVTCSCASTVVNQTAGLTDGKTFSLPVKGLKALKSVRYFLGRFSFQHSNGKLT